jgi:redox-sensitive bicupin YhaK (pirin superfamily)
MGFRSLRVINDDIVEAGGGFPTHGHRDMEIITLVLEGALEHKDSLGHGEVLRPGEVQVMTAGRGIRHSEFNPSPTARAHFLQIWILPERQSLQPAYGQKAFPVEGRREKLQRVAGPDRPDADGALKINQDASLYMAEPSAGASVSHVISSGRAAWIHLIAGRLRVGDQALEPGDAAFTEDAGLLAMTAMTSGTSLIMFDLA